MSMEKLKPELRRLFVAVWGIFLFSFGLNVFIVPVNLYNGGVVGLGQIIAAALERSFGLSFSFDLSGIIVYVINIPLFFLAYRSMGRLFFIKTLVCVTMQSVFMLLIPIPKEPIVGEMLTSCLIGGIITGYGVGVTLRAGSSGGGLDILGVYLAKKSPDASVGRIAIAINAVIYGVCLFMFDITVVIYSLIYTTVQALSLDRTHTQNVNVEVFIIARRGIPEIRAAITRELMRTATVWSGEGCYTGEQATVLYSIMSKYEVRELKRILRTIDPDAFVTVKEGISIAGNYQKHL